MVTHCSTLAWGIPWTEEPGGVQSMGSQRDTTEQMTVSILWEAVVVGRAPKLPLVLTQGTHGGKQTSLCTLAHGHCQLITVSWIFSRI